MPDSVSLIRKFHKTWDRKNGSWKKVIYAGYRESFLNGEYLPKGIYTTKLAALKFALNESEKGYQWSVNEMAKETDQKEIKAFEHDLQIYNKEIKLLKSRITKVRNSK